MTSLSSEEKQEIEDFLHKFLDISPGQVNVENDKVLELVAQAARGLFDCDKTVGGVGNFLMPLPVRSGPALISWLVKGIGGSLKDRIKIALTNRHNPHCLNALKLKMNSAIRIAGMLD